jgi:hypothetical protein
MYAIYPSQLILLNLAVRIIYIEGLSSEVPRYVVYITFPLLSLMSDCCSQQLAPEQYQSVLVQMLCFWTLSIVSETGFCLRLQVEPTQLGPIDRASPYLQTLLKSEYYQNRSQQQ